MDRPIIYLGAQAQDTDMLRSLKAMMLATGGVIRMVAGKQTVAVGFECVPTSPPSLAVVLDSGGLSKFTEIDATDYGRLAADENLIPKIGYNEAPATFNITPPATPGQTKRYIIQAAFDDSDADPVVLPYYNDTDPNQALYGPNNNGEAQFTTRKVSTIVELKPGTSATTGTELTPVTSPGYVGLYIISVNFGQTAITSNDITKHPEFPSLGGAVAADPTNIVFTSSTTYNYTGTAPTWAKVTVVGGGGGGGGNQTNGAAGGGGGGGTAISFIKLIPGTAYAITVGAGGIAGGNSSSGNGGSYPNPPTPANAGGNGGSSSFAGLVNATGGGGGGGTGAYGNGNGGFGGVGSYTSPANGAPFRGGDGDPGFFPAQVNGGRGGRGGGSMLGGGGRSSSGIAWGSTATPSAGGFPGGGAGGGGSGNVGAAGAPGCVIVEIA